MSLGCSFENIQLLHRLHPNTTKLPKLVELNILSITVSLEKFQNASIMSRRPVQKEGSQQNSVFFSFVIVQDKKLKLLS